MRALYDRARALLPADTDWFDAHTHIGQNDPDGLTCTLDELFARLDDAGHRRALVFPMHEPDGYRRANDVVLEAAAGSGGRLTALARVAPDAGDALDEARRALEAGARGIKLHPRSDAFGLPHVVVQRIVALVAEVRGVVLIHAGRGIPHLGEAATDLARQHPDARIVLAHAGISDLGWIGSAAAELPNLLFDTAWWQVSDVLELFHTVPPGQIVYGSDIPYGTGVLGGLICLRAGQAAGLAPATLAEIAGGQLARIVAGEAPRDLGPPPGAPRDARSLRHERVVSYLTAAGQQTFGGSDATEALALARLACRTLTSDPLLARVDEMIAEVQHVKAEAGPDERWPGAVQLIVAQVVAGTPGVPV